MLSNTERFQDIWDAVRDLCTQFSRKYFHKIDDQRGYPEEFVHALTKAGWILISLESTIAAVSAKKKYFPKGL